MGVNTASVTKVLLTNVEAANTGTSLATIADGDILVLNKNMTVLTGTPKISDSGNDTIYIAQGKANGKFELSQPIQLKGVSVAKKQAYVAHAAQAGTITIPAVANNDKLQLVVLKKDEHRVNVQRQTRRFYEVTVVTGDTATTVAAKFVAKINRDSASVVSASNAAGVITLTAKAIESSYMDTFARNLFDAVLNKDNAVLASYVSTVAPERGKGTPVLLRELEQSTLRNNRLAHPVIDPKLKAVDGNGYNRLAISHRNLSPGDFSGQVSSPMTAFIAFKTTVTAQVHGPSAKETAVLGVLESLIESAGVFVQ